MKAIAKIDNAQDVASALNHGQDVVVIGQSMATRVIPYADEIGALYYEGFSHYYELSKVNTVLTDAVGYIDHMAYISGKSFTGARFIDMGWDFLRVGEKGLWWSKFTIYSERFFAEVARFDKVLRIIQHFYL